MNFFDRILASFQSLQKRFEKWQLRRKLKNIMEDDPIPDEALFPEDNVSFLDLINDGNRKELILRCKADIGGQTYPYTLDVTLPLK